MSRAFITTASSSSVHYVSDNLYTLGSLSCAVCGHQFPLTTSPHNHAVCGNCGTTHQPGTALGAAFRAEQHRSRALHGVDNEETVKGGGGLYGAGLSAQLAAAQFFTRAEIDEAVARVGAACGGGGVGGALDGGDGTGESSGTVRAGQTAVDNRVLEEAFCENCATHRMCKTFARQTRSADEGQTIFFQCTVCNAEWQQSS